MIPWKELLIPLLQKISLTHLQSFKQKRPKPQVWIWREDSILYNKFSTIKMRIIFLFNFSYLDSRAMGGGVIKINTSNYHNSVLFITGNILSKILVCFAELVYLFESSLWQISITLSLGKKCAIYINLALKIISLVLVGLKFWKFPQ